jgi:hypothetical protein
MANGRPTSRPVAARYWGRLRCAVRLWQPNKPGSKLTGLRIGASFFGMLLRSEATHVFHCRRRAVPRALRKPECHFCLQNIPRKDDSMTQHELERELARATGETVSTIRQRGFSLIESPEREPLTVDWDALQAERMGVLPARAQRHAA